MRRLIFIGCLLWGGITWMRFPVVAYGLLSFVLTIAALPARGLPSNLLPAEFWIASLAWIGGGIYLGLLLKRSLAGKKEHHRHPVTAATATLACSAFFAFVCPIIAPLPYDAQGHLVTTRLKAPLSIGEIRITTDDPALHEGGSIAALLTGANAYLLGRRISPAAGPGDTAGDTSPFVFVLGTDDAGRDILSRLIYGARASLSIGFFSAVGAVILGLLVGVTAGYAGNVWDTLLMRITDLFLAVPAIFLAIGMVAFLGNSITTLVLILASTGWMSIARVMRNDIASLRQREFMVAAGMLGLPQSRILLRHMIPNVRPLLITAGVLQFANAVLGEAALSFLGLGVQPPTPTWGNMMGDATVYLQRAWWMGVFPGLALAVVLVAAHRATATLVSPGNGEMHRP